MRKFSAVMESLSFFFLENEIQLIYNVSDIQQMVQIYIYISYIYFQIYIYKGFPGGSDSKESACNAGNPCLFSGSGRSPGEGNGNPFQYPCLENPMGRGAW